MRNKARGVNVRSVGKASKDSIVNKFIVNLGVLGVLMKEHCL